MQLLKAFFILCLFLMATPGDTGIHGNNGLTGSSHDEIAEALGRIYKFFVKIGYVTEEEMKWPPHSSADLDLDFARSQGLDENAIDLLQKIPWSTSFIKLELESYLINFSSNDDLQGSRHPDIAFDYPDEYNPIAEGWLVSIAVYSQGEGVPISIDTRSGLLLRDHAFGLKESNGEPYDAHNPVEYLTGLLEEFSTLEAIPVNGNILNAVVSPEGLSYDAEACYQPTKDALYQHGWPDNFRVDDWRKYMTWDLWHRWTEEHYDRWRAREKEEQYKKKLAEERLAAERMAKLQINRGGPPLMEQL